MNELAPPPSVQSLIDEALMAEREAQGTRETAGGARWRASTLGYCLRSQTMQARGYRQVQELPLNIIRRFSVGYIFSDWLEAKFKGLGILVSVEQPLYHPKLNLGAHCDFIIGGKGLPYTGVELKTAHSRSWWHAKEKGGAVAGHHQLVQAAAQGLLWESLEKRPKVERWIVLTVSKDDLCMAEDVCEDQHFVEAYRRAQILNQHWEAGTYPPCTCMVDMDGLYWKYCRYYEGSEKSKRGKDPRPDGACCIPRGDM